MVTIHHTIIDLLKISRGHFSVYNFITAKQSMLSSKLLDIKKSQIQMFTLNCIKPESITMDLPEDCFLILTTIKESIMTINAAAFRI